MRSVDEVRQHMVERLNHSVRRPGMYTPRPGLDASFQLVLGDLAYLDEAEDALERAMETEVKRPGMWSSTGVQPALDRAMPGREHWDTVASIYARVGWRMGWLDVAVVVEPAELDDAAATMRASLVPGSRGADVRRLRPEWSIDERGWVALVATDGRWLNVDLDPWQPGPDREPSGFGAAEDALVTHLRLPAETLVEGLVPITPPRQPRPGQTIGSW